MYEYTHKWEWLGTDDLDPISYKCYNCGERILSNQGYECIINEYSNQPVGKIYICHNCKSPTYFSKCPAKQVPGSKYGDEIQYLPDDVREVYDEARNCFSVNAFTSVVLCCRKILMSVACELGADEGKRFVEYVNYLDDENYIPRNTKSFIDKIRLLGNDGTHKLEKRTQEDAELALKFTIILLKNVYEMPKILENS